MATVVAQTEASAITVPTDRSMPPPMITNVMPTVITPMIEAEVRMVSMFERVRNVSAVTTPTMPSSTSTATRPRLRTGAAVQQPRSGPAERRGLARRPAPPGRCSSTAGTAVFGVGVGDGARGIRRSRMLSHARFLP